MNLRFEWDARKGILFEEAMTVFNDPLSMPESREIILESPRNSGSYSSVSPNVGRQFVSSAPAKPPNWNAKTMKKLAVRKRSLGTIDKMRDEYRFDYTKAKPNRFAGRIKSGTVAVILDPDVAAVFSTLPGQKHKRAKAG